MSNRRLPRAVWLTPLFSWAFLFLQTYDLAAQNVRTMLSELGSGIHTYYADNQGLWPQALDRQPFLGTYVKKLPKEPSSGMSRVVGAYDGSGGWVYVSAHGGLIFPNSKTYSKSKNYEELTGLGRSFDDILKASRSLEVNALNGYVNSLGEIVADRVRRMSGSEMASARKGSLGEILVLPTDEHGNILAKTSSSGSVTWFAVNPCDTMARESFDPESIVTQLDTAFGKHTKQALDLNGTTGTVRLWRAPLGEIVELIAPNQYEIKDCRKALLSIYRGKGIKYSLAAALEDYWSALPLRVAPSSVQFATSTSEEVTVEQKQQLKSKCSEILRDTIDYTHYFDRDMRISDTYRPEQQLEEREVACSEPDSCGIEIWIVPRSDWKQQRAMTARDGGATPAEAQEWMGTWKPTREEKYAEFRVNFLTRTVYSVDSNASMMITLDKRAKEMRGWDDFRAE